MAGRGTAAVGGVAPPIDAALRRLRDEGRRSVRIVDVDCGTGRRLRRVARRARALGFVTVEARGCAGAGGAAPRGGDPAVGWTFDDAAPERALAEEAEGGDADLILAPALLAAGWRCACGTVVPTRGSRHMERGASGRHDLAA